MPRIRLLPYKAGSRGCRALSVTSGIRRVRLVRTRFRAKAGDIIVNWGNPRWDDFPMFDCCTVLNNPDAVAVAGNKLLAYQAMEKAGVSIPAFTADPNEAQTWVDKGGVVVVRQLLCASEGKGISVIEKGGQVPRHAPLYTRYIPKFDEYRVHVWDGQVIDIQQKKLRRGDDEREADTRIRNAKFGWVFCREAVECPEVVTQEAIKAAKALGLDFGAIDIGHTRNRNRATVYEANTAPGLEGTTLERYSARIRRAGGACRG